MSSSGIRITKTALTWLLVIVPLGWGVTKSVQKSLPLFQGGGEKAPAAAPAIPKQP